MNDRSDDQEGLARRRQLRADLLARRRLPSPAQRTAWDASIEARLQALLPAHPVDGAPPVLGLCWPLDGEFDARGLARRFIAAGGLAALPVVVTRAAPLAFRRWRPGEPMVADRHGISVPASDEPLMPEVLLVPMVGFDEMGYRLGYGGGYFDRTLAQPGAPVAIGVGYELSRVAGIVPGAHDVALPLIVTEAGVFARGADRLTTLSIEQALRLLPARWGSQRFG